MAIRSSPLAGHRLPRAGLAAGPPAVRATGGSVPRAGRGHHLQRRAAARHAAPLALAGQRLLVDPGRRLARRGHGHRRGRLRLAVLLHSVYGHSGRCDALWLWAVARCCAAVCQCGRHRLPGRPTADRWSIRLPLAALAADYRSGGLSTRAGPTGRSSAARATAPIQCTERSNSCPRRKPRARRRLAGRGRRHGAVLRQPECCSASLEWPEWARGRAARADVPHRRRSE